MAASKPNCPFCPVPGSCHCLSILINNNRPEPDGTISWVLKPPQVNNHVQMWPVPTKPGQSRKPTFRENSWQSQFGLELSILRFGCNINQELFLFINPKFHVDLITISTIFQMFFDATPIRNMTKISSREWFSWIKLAKYTYFSRAFLICWTASPMLYLVSSESLWCLF